jgi:hypothetical protein
MNSFVNLGLMAHPLNWITMLVWLVIIGFTIHMFHPALMGNYKDDTK